MGMLSAWSQDLGFETPTFQSGNQNRNGQLCKYNNGQPWAVCSLFSYSKNACAMNVLIGFEVTQASCIEFRKLGHDAFSCDLQPAGGGHPEWHLNIDIFEAINLKRWDLIILHPPCTYTALCGNRWYWDSPLRNQGVELCRKSWQAACDVCGKVVLEQPKTIMQRFIGPKSQVIHPWQFGHGETKETWLWINGLPNLVPTNIVSGRENKIWKMPPSAERSKLRSKTYPGIAKAFANQFSTT